MNRIKATWRNGSFKKWMIIRFIPNQTTNLPIKDVLPNFFLLQIILAATVNGKCGIQVYIPPNNSDDHCFLLSLYPSSMNCSTVFGPSPVIQRKNWFMNQWMRKFCFKNLLKFTCSRTRETICSQPLPVCLQAGGGT